MAKQRYWYIDKHKLGIVEKSTNAVTKENVTSNYSSVSEVKDLRVYAISKPDALYSSTSSEGGANYLTVGTDPALTEIPEQFHEVTVNKVIANGYKDPRNLNIDLAQFFEAEYLMGLREAKKFSKSRYRKGGYIKAYDF